MTVRMKFCGLTKPADIPAAAEAGAAYVGFVSFPKSPRHLEPAQARALALEVPAGIVKVALMVNPDDAALDAYLDQVPIDMVQLHGGESPERVAEVAARTGLPVMKAIGVATVEDLDRIADYAGAAHQVLVDAKPPKGADLPGGNGASFDWTLLSGRRWSLPWMLAGGLTPDNVAEAVRITGATQVDLSSGIERAPGDKDPAKMQAFAEALAKA